MYWTVPFVLYITLYFSCMGYCMHFTVPLIPGWGPGNLKQDFSQAPTWLAIHLTVLLWLGRQWPPAQVVGAIWLCSEMTHTVSPLVSCPSVL
jgi:hypothetical protein